MAIFSNSLRAFLVAVCVMCVGIADAQIFTTYPYTLQNGTLADATQVMADFTSVATQMNSNAAKNAANTDLTSIRGLGDGTVTVPTLSFLNLSGWGFFNDTTNNCFALSANQVEVSCWDQNGLHNLPSQTNPKPNDAATVAWTQSLMGSYNVGGRLTLASGTPVMASSVTGGATIYFTPYLSNAMIYSDGTNLHAGVFTEMAQALSDTTLSPAAAVANSIYDMFLWYFTSTTFTGVRANASNILTSIGSIPGGTSSLTVGATVTGTGIPGGTTILQILTATSIKLSANATSNGSATFSVNQSFINTYVISRGPLWSGGTTRTTALTSLNGVQVNATSITNGPAAHAGVWLGTVATDGGGATVSWIHGTAASGGGQASLGVWNQYNRILVAESVQNTIATWTYASGTPREADGSTTWGAAWVTGALEDGFTASYQDFASTSATVGGNCQTGIGVNSSSTFSTFAIAAYSAAAAVVSGSGGANQFFGPVAPSLGLNSVSAMEATPTGTCTFHGSTSGGILTFQTRM